MDKVTALKKNRLDLEYHSQIQLLNTVLLFTTTGLLSFVGTFVWKPELMLLGTLISIFVLMVCLIAYKRIQSNLRKILEEITGLASQNL